MSLPTGFQLSLELTNIIGPVAESVLRYGSLAVLQGLNRSGSDGFTELHLASTLGQHRVAEYMRENFRTIVGQSRQHSLPGLLEAAKQLILEAGAGPTVRQAITNPNPAWLSMVIQVSLLAFVHETQSLAQAITGVFASSGTAGNDGPNYVSVLGVIHAVQEQTAEFLWVGFFERVEEQLSQSVETAPHRRWKRARKQRLDTTSRAAALNRIAHRCLPFCILKALFIYLTSIQDLPEHRNLHLRTVSGCSMVVVWCYYVLGISVSVQIYGTNVLFGDDPRIFVEDCGAFPASATVLDALDEHEPLFKLSQADEDPVLDGEDRAIARGFVRKVLRSYGVSDLNMVGLANWLAASCIEFLSASAELEFGPLHVTSMTSQVRDNISNSVALLFDIAPLDFSTAGSTKPLGSTETAPWRVIILIILSFARIRCLEHCEEIPLSLRAVSQMHTDKHFLNLGVAGLAGRIPNTLASFDIISHLLLGSQYSTEYVADSALVSARGWSVYLDSLTAVDVGDIAPGVIHARMGVPSRNGERKSQIVDGPTDVGMEDGEVLDTSEIAITFWPGISTARLCATLIGYYGHRGFSVVQVFEWADANGEDTRKWRLGFRDKHQMALKFSIVDHCPCGGYYGVEGAQDWIDGVISQGAIARYGSGSSRVTQRYPNTADATTPERVFSIELASRTNAGQPKSAWFFFITENKAARWLALDGLDQLNGGKAGFGGVIRGSNCCVECVCQAVVGKSLVLL